MSSQDSGLIWTVAWQCSPQRFPGGWVFQATRAFPAPPGPHLSSPEKPLPPPLSPSCISAFREEHPMGKPVLSTPLTRYTSEECNYTVHSLMQYAFTFLSSPPESGHLGQWLQVRRQATWGRPNAKVDRHWIASIFRTHFPSHAKKPLDQRFFTQAFGFLPLCTYLSPFLSFPTCCGLESTFWSGSKADMPCWKDLPRQS